MSRFAPMSTPRVGSSSTITFGPGCSTFASASFCWLPPESDEALMSSEPVRMPKSVTAVFSAAVSASGFNHGAA